SPLPFIFSLSRRRDGRSKGARRDSTAACRPTGGSAQRLEGAEWSRDVDATVSGPPVDRTRASPPPIRNFQFTFFNFQSLSRVILHPWTPTWYKKVAGTNASLTGGRS